MNRITRSWSTMRRLSRINLTIGSALLLVFGYVAVTLYFGAASQVRYASNDFPGAKKASTAFLTLSPIQRHIGYYNRGTAEAAVGDFEPAQADLESALEITPVRDECAVRINLSYVYEKLADEVADQDPDQSDELYDQSLQTLEDAPEECQPKKSEEKNKSDEAKKRVEDKKAGEKSKQEGSDSSEGDDAQNGDSGGDSKKKDKGQDSGEGDEKSDDSEGKSEEEKKRDKLKERGEDSERQQRQQGPGGNGGRSTPDKPW
ncbi:MULTISPECIES: tetratricopeptide repeat protein [Brevibacterium]|uniref:Uncharacterized protein n=2 Tax=Brevibacterium antiquum TaxID=234835 RepID=A0A2H1KWQ3_9MICO|nr:MULTISPECIES: hypothetical protein [Brevibacterium]SMX69366.1 hypothetical protein BANT10_00481 [Brevibacterium antiquum]SMY04167.1 hypothetical protein BANT918_02998 [Brevibacterium antiquum CNRZ 918]HCG55482.1 hypothetical protein [Brevibacterium sp.]